MTTSFEARKMQVRPLSQDILVHGMDMGEQKTAAGIVIHSDDGKAHINLFYVRQFLLVQL